MCIAQIKWSLNLVSYSPCWHVSAVRETKSLRSLPNAFSVRQDLPYPVMAKAKPFSQPTVCVLWLSCLTWREGKKKKLYHWRYMNVEFTARNTDWIQYWLSQREYSSVIITAERTARYRRHSPLRTKGNMKSGVETETKALEKSEHTGTCR